MISSSFRVAAVVRILGLSYAPEHTVPGKAKFLMAQGGWPGGYVLLYNRYLTTIVWYPVLHIRQDTKDTRVGDIAPSDRTLHSLGSVRVESS